MSVVQFSLLSLALITCSYTNDLQRCLEDEGVSIIFKVISQLSENGEISNTTWNEIERYLTDSCKNINESYEFVNEVKCINFIQSALDRIAYNYTNNTYLPKPLREECPELFYRGWFNVGLLAVGVFIIIALSFTKRRNHFAKNICYGFPGVIIPVNLLQSRRNNFIYVVIFGAMASDILSSIFIPSHELKVLLNDAWSSVLLSYGQMMLQTLYFSPLLACTHTPIKLLGYSFGLLYSLYFTSIKLTQLEAVKTNCVYYRGDLTHLYPLVELPTYICLLIITIWYSFNIILSVYKMCHFCDGNMPAVKRKRTHRYIIRIRKLLSRSYHEKEKHSRIIAFIHKYAYDPTFHCPLGFSCAVLISTVCIFQLTFLLIIISLEGTRWLHNVLDRFEEIIDLLAFSVSRINIDFYRYFKDVAVFLDVVVPLVPLVAGVFCYILLYLLVVNVRDNIKRLYAGDASFLPKKKPAPTNMLSSGLRYTGYQVGYFVWTWVIATLILYIAVVLIFIYLLLLRIDFSSTLNWTLFLIIPTIISTVVRYAQLYFARFAFLQDKAVNLSLTNLQAFHWFQFMMIFLNVVIGITSALLRNILSLAFGLLLMPRLDRSVMMKGFVKFDSGYKTYVGFLYLNLYHNNAVVNMFCLLLYNSVFPICIKKSLRNSHSELNDIIAQLNNHSLKDGSEHEAKSKVAFNRWLVAYTLMKNPQLQKLRGHYIVAKKASDIGSQTVTGKSEGDKEMEANNEEINNHDLSMAISGDEDIIDDNKILADTII